MNFYQRSSIFTPCLVRLLARKKGGRPLTQAEIYQASGLSGLRIALISEMTSWDQVDLPTMRAFTTACGIDLCNRQQLKKAVTYIKFCARPRSMAFEYLRRDPLWLDYYRPLIDTWRSSYGTVTKQSDIWPPLRALLMRIPLIKK